MNTPSHLLFQGIFGDFSLFTPSATEAHGQDLGGNPVSQSSVNPNAMCWGTLNPCPNFWVRTAPSPSWEPQVLPL